MKSQGPPLSAEARREIRECRRRIKALEAIPHYGPASQHPDDKAAYQEEKFQVRQEIQTLCQRIQEMGGDPSIADTDPWKWVLWVMMSLLLALFIGPCALTAIQAVRTSQHAQQIIREMGLTRQEIARDPRVPLLLNDFSLSPDRSRLVFSQQVPVKTTLRKRFRLLLSDTWASTAMSFQLYRMDTRTLSDLDWEDHVGPLFSRDGKRIAFAVTRDDHPTTICVVDEDGRNLKRVSMWHGTVAFGWASDDELFIWSHYACDANICDPVQYAQGDSCVVAVAEYVAPEPRALDSRPREKPTYVPSGQIEVRCVSRGRVSGFLIERKK